MSQMTNFMENALADFLRGAGITLPTNWYLALGSAAADGSFTELSGTGYARVSVARSLANWAGTQGAGSTLASSGTSHATSNNNAISWGTPGSNWGTAAFVGLFDDPSAGNCWMYVAVPAVTITTGNPDPVQVAAGSLTLTLGLTGGVSDDFSNSLIDLIWRAQSYSMPASIWLGLFTSAPTNAGGGTEVSGGSYARAEIETTFADLSSTQGDDQASTGSGGRVSNLNVVAYPQPSGDWGTVVAEGVFDLSSGGTFLMWRSLVTPQTIVADGPPPTHAVDSFAMTLA